MVYGLWLMAYGLLFMVYSSWFLAYGLWCMVLVKGGLRRIREGKGKYMFQKGFVV